MAIISGQGRINGTKFDDIIFGDFQTNDEIYGFSGDDSLHGSYGKDHLFGGEGDDTLSGGRDADYMDGGDGIDEISYFTSSAGVSVSLQDGKGHKGDAAGDEFINIEDVFGSQHADTIDGDNNDNQLDGYLGDDVLFGMSGDDTLLGGGGSDILNGGDGRDRLDGGSEGDILTGGANADVFILEHWWMSDVDIITDFGNGQDQIETELSKNNIDAYWTSHNGEKGTMITNSGTDIMFVVDIGVTDVLSNIDFI